MGAWRPVKRLLQKFNSGLIAARIMTVVSMEGRIMVPPKMSKGFPGGAVVKSLPANAGDADSIPGSGRFLEKEMATHSSILAWRIPWTEDPGRPQSTGSQRVGYD